MIYDIILIAVICTIVVDMTDFVQHIKKWIWKWLKDKQPFKDFELKPFDCSLCATFWTSVIYLLCTGSLSLTSLALTLLIAISTDIIRQAIVTLKTIVSAFIQLIYNLIEGL